MEHEAGTPYVDAGAKAVAASGQDLSASITITGAVDVEREGRYTLLFEVVDKHGLPATAARTVVVVDTWDGCADGPCHNGGTCRDTPHGFTCACAGTWSGPLCTGGCTDAHSDVDGDGVVDCNDACPVDLHKVSVGACGCGTSDVDADGDRVPACLEECDGDAAKQAAGVCGCGVADVDSDGDSIPDCLDECPANALKIVPGPCGCGVWEVDSDHNGYVLHVSTYRSAPCATCLV